MRKIHFSVITFILLACTTISAWAVPNPPPVNQNLGIPDTQFLTLFEDPDLNNDTHRENTCKRCHKPEYYGLWLSDANPVNGFTGIRGIPELQEMYLPNRHHQHVADTPNAVRGGLIAGGAEQPPFPVANDHSWNVYNINDPGAPPADTEYDCLNCHEVNLVNGQPWGLLDNFRNCMNCHIVLDPDDPGTEASPNLGTQTVHHDTPKARAQQCGVCHGYLIRSVDAGVPAAAYRPSMITPWPSGKTHGDGTKANANGTEPGNCNFCHNTVDDTLNGTIDNTSNFSSAVGRTGMSFGAIEIFTNKQNHHGTGVNTFKTANIVGGETVCNWCHIPDYPAAYTSSAAYAPCPAPVAGEYCDPAQIPDDWGIRGCQRCHDIESLHSIEADVDEDGIVPGGETAYNGHIGNQDNCWGCHGNDGDVSVGTASGSFAVTSTPAQLDGINLQAWPEGTSFEMSLTGNSFINWGSAFDANGTETQVEYLPSVQFTDEAGNATVLEPNEAPLSGLVKVTVPDTLAAGVYTVQIKKDLKLSNPVMATVIPVTQVENAVCYANYRVVIVRADFISTNIPGPIDLSGTGIADENGNLADAVYRWKAGMIAARFNGGCPSTVTVTNVFGSVTTTPELR